MSPDTHRPLHRALRPLRLRPAGAGAGLRAGRVRGRARPFRRSAAARSIDRVDRAALARTGIAAPARADDAATRCASSPAASRCPGTRSASSTRRARAARARTRAASSSAGRRRPAATSAIPRRRARCSTADWLDTGDLGYVAGGELYLTGRAKDIIIRGGQHIHPQELEEAIGDIAGRAQGLRAVFGVAGPRRRHREGGGARRNPRDRPGPPRRAAGEIVELAGRRCSARRRTTSSWRRRTRCSRPPAARSAAPRAARLYERGMLRAGRVRLWPQLVRLALAGVAATLRRSLRRAGEVLYGAYAWALFAPLALAALVLVAVLPRLAWRRRAATVLARAFLAAARIPVRVAGARALSAGGPDHRRRQPRELPRRHRPARRGAGALRLRRQARAHPPRAGAAAAGAHRHPLRRALCRRRAASRPHTRSRRRRSGAPRSSSSPKARCGASRGCCRSIWARSGRRRRRHARDPARAARHALGAARRPVAPAPRRRPGRRHAAAPAGRQRLGSRGRAARGGPRGDPRGLRRARRRRARGRAVS